jgi:DDE superfamily endonuclease
MKLPAFAVPVGHMCQPAVSTPTPHRFFVLWLETIFTTGRWTVTKIIRTVRPHATGYVSADHRVCSPRHWSTWKVARRWLTVRLTYGLPTGPVWLAGDDPLAARPGPHVFGQARHRDGVRSTHRDTAYRWGHPWGVVSGLVQWPGAVRPWALPVWVAWYRSPEWAPAPGTRHQTPAHLTRRLLARLIRWLPARRCIVGGETGYGTSETARFCGRECSDKER